MTWMTRSLGEWKFERKAIGKSSDSKGKNNLKAFSTYLYYKQKFLQGVSRMIKQNIKVMRKYSKCMIYFPDKNKLVNSELQHLNYQCQ